MIDRFVNNVINADHSTTLKGFLGSNNNWGVYWFNIEEIIIQLKDAQSKGKNVFSLKHSCEVIDFDMGKTQTKEDAISEEIKQHLDHIEKLKEELKK
jgi:hypothetical protein